MFNLYYDDAVNDAIHLNFHEILKVNKKCRDTTKCICSSVAEHNDATKAVKMSINMKTCQENTLAKNESAITAALKNVQGCLQEVVFNEDKTNHEIEWTV